MWPSLNKFVIKNTKLFVNDIRVWPMINLAILKNFEKLIERIKNKEYIKSKVVFTIVAYGNMSCCKILRSFTVICFTFHFICVVTKFCNMHFYVRTKLIMCLTIELHRC